MHRAVLPLLLAATCASADTARVAQLPAKVVPEQAATLMLEAGRLSDWLAPEATGHVEQGAVLAVLNKERTEQEREEMELQLAKEELNTRDEIRKLQAQRRQIEFYLKLDERERAYADSKAAGDEPLSRETLRDVDERLALLRRMQESAARIKRNEFRRNHDKLTLRMPFSGRVQYSVKLPPDGSAFDYAPAPGRPFATVCDDSAFYITVNLSRADLTQLAPEKLHVVVSLPEGQQLTARYDHRSVEQSNHGDMLVYFFRLPTEAHATAFSLLGSNPTAQLFYDTGENTLTVNKAELAARPEAETCRDWEELIVRLYPEHRIVVIGERDIILRPVEPS
ncbi:MAG: hypothetical protein ACI4OS_02570 [Akkermansia sp.]